MKKMRFFSNFLLSGALITGLSGCQSTEETPTGGAQVDNTSTQTQEEPELEVLRVGIDLKYFPFMYQDESGAPAGLEPAISYAFAAYLDIPVEIVNTDFSMLIPALETDSVDIVISDMSCNESRLEKADFSDPYRFGHTLALVNADFAAANNVSNDMNSDEFFALEAEYVGLSGTIAVTIPLEQGKEVVEVTDVATAVLDVSRGNYDIIVGSDTIRGDHAANPDTTVIYEGISDFTDSRFVVKKGNEALLEQANNFIATLYEEGGLYEEIGTSMDDIIGDFFQDSSLGLSYVVTPPT